MSNPAVRGMAAVAVVLTCACNTRSSEVFSVTDSAGVSIAVNAAAAAVPVARPEVELSIGAAEGEPHLLFGSVMDVDADAAGNIYVLDAQASEVRVFTRDGEYLQTLGRRGQGPGELSPWVNAVIAGDDGMIYVPDSGQRRVNIFEPSGTVLPAIALPPRPSGQSWVRRPDGRFLVGGMAVSRDAGGRFTFWEGLLLTRLADAVDGAGTAYDTIASFDFPRTDVGSPEDIRVPVIVNTAYWAPLGADHVAWGSLDRAEVRLLNAAGVLERIIRHDGWRLRPLGTGEDAEFRRLLRERLTSLGGDASAADGAAVIFPDSLPAITSLLAGPRGTLWVQRMGGAAEATPDAVNATGRSRWLGGHIWDVIDSTGRHVQRVELPAGVRPLRIKTDLIYGVATDPQGVQRVVRLRFDWLRRGLWLRS